MFKELAEFPKKQKKRTEQRGVTFRERAGENGSAWALLPLVGKQLTLGFSCATGLPGTAGQVANCTRLLGQGCVC